MLSSDAWILQKIQSNREKKSFVLQIDRRIMFIAQGHIELYRNIKLNFILECLASAYFFVYFIWYLVEPRYFLYNLPYVRIKFENNTSKRYYFDWKILRRRERESDILVAKHYKWIDWNFNNSFLCRELIYDLFCHLETNELTCTNNIDLKYVWPFEFV